MSNAAGEHHIALLRDAIEAFNEGDASALERFFDPEVECVVGPRLVNTGTFHGHEGYLEMVTAWNEAWGELENRIVDASAPDERHVIAEIHQTATGSVSGVPVEMTVFYFVEIRDERAVRLHIYAERQEALDAIR